MIDRHGSYSALDKSAADTPDFGWDFLLPLYDVCNIGELVTSNKVEIIRNHQNL